MYFPRGVVPGSQNTARMVGIERALPDSAPFSSILPGDARLWARTWGGSRDNGSCGPRIGPLWLQDYGRYSDGRKFSSTQFSETPPMRVNATRWPSG